MGCDPGTLRLLLRLIQRSISSNLSSYDSRSDSAMSVLSNATHSNATATHSNKTTERWQGGGGEGVKSEEDKIVL
jgi:hypothetical protein